MLTVRGFFGDDYRLSGVYAAFHVLDNGIVAFKWETFFFFA